MKNTYKLAILAALGLASMTAYNAKAASAGTTDLALGFNDNQASAPTSAQNDYVIDLGAFTQFTTTSSVDVSSAFSASTFSSEFSTDGNYLSDVSAGATGGNALNGIVFQTGTSTPAKIASASNFNSAANYAGSAVLGTYPSSGGTGTFTTQIASVAGGTTGNYTGVASNPLGKLSSGLLTLELFEATLTGSGRNQTVNAFSELGTLAINVTSGAITYTGVDYVAPSIPEPGTYGVLAAGGLLLVSLRRQIMGKIA